MLLSFRRTSVLLWIGLTKLTLYAAFRCMGSRNAIFLVKKLILLDLCVYCLTNLRPESLCCSAGFGYALNCLFVDDACYQIEKCERNARQMGVLPYIPRLAILATNLPDDVSIMFVALERTAQIDPKYVDIVLLENYAAFQNRVEELMYNVAPEEVIWCITEAKTWYHQKLKGDVRESCNVDNISHLALQKEFLEKYGSFVQLVVRIYPNETVPSVIEMREALSNL
ncbi:hypothetical protein B296_00024491 [Ensete ventricosum]|uniref:Uncharacterized protein n=1 Tax=Ensete ventricosum TaxID=4639 RepID=A0A426ZSA5_ENSVE|nr:hypothetical protein B296_00024491 [Ensete ventricosum]